MGCSPRSTSSSTSPSAVCRKVSASIAAMPRPRSGCATAITIRCSASGHRDGRQSVAQSGGELLVRRRLAGEIDVEVEHREVVARERGGVAGEGVGEGTDVVELGVGGREVVAAALER